MAVTVLGRKESKHTRNMFLPESVGGMGVIPPQGWKFRIKKVDRLIGGLFYNRAGVSPRTGVSSQYPLPGPPKVDFDTVVMVPWGVSTVDLGLPTYNLQNCKKVDKDTLKVGIIPYLIPTLRQRLGAEMLPPLLFSCGLFRPNPEDVFSQWQKVFDVPEHNLDDGYFDHEVHEDLSR